MNNLNITPIVKYLLGINIVFFIATWLFENQGEFLAGYLGAYYFDSPAFKLWQPFTHMFMHGGVAHIFMNMFGLVMIGGILEIHWGGKRFLNFYLITGLGALLVQWTAQAFQVYQITGSVVNDLSTLKLDEIQIEALRDLYFVPMVGASGAVFGVMTAFAVLYPNIELYIMFIPIPVKAKYFVPAYILFEIVMGFGRFQGDSVAHFAHLGGALIGYILVKIWRNKNTYYDYYD